MRLCSGIALVDGAVQSLICGCDRLRWEHESVDQEEHFLAREELLDHISPIALREVREVYLAAVDKIEFRFALYVLQALAESFLLANVLSRL